MDRPDQKVILTPDQRLRVFVSSTLQELAPERKSARQAVERLHMAPVMFELGARPHPPRSLYRAYLEQSHIFVGIYWQSYGWVAPGEDVSGLEDEYNLSGDRPKLIYVKSPAGERQSRLKELLDRIKADDRVSYKTFSTAAELRRLIEHDLALLLTERFESTQAATAHESLRDEDSREANQEHRFDLPVPPNPLVGRETEVATIRKLLMQSDARLVTLAGAGGIGKTRLSIEVAQQVHNEFADGACFVSLAAVSDPSLVIPTIARSLGITEGDGDVLLSNLHNYLQTRHILLVLDNFEQVTEAAASIRTLLDTAPKLKILITSREILRLYDEHVFVVPPLSLPDIRYVYSVTQLSQYNAIRLFIERAKAIKPEFTLTDQNSQAVAEVCSKLDGLPLAIELAAARIRLLPPQAMLSRLQSRLGLLTSGARDLPARQRTLRNTIDWSYDLLNADEQRLLARLGVFVGGCTLEAAESVCDPNSSLDVLEGMMSLSDKSLVGHEEGHSGEPRFVLLGAIREYALERLEADGEARELQCRHAEYYVSLAEQSGPHLIGAKQAEWLERLEIEHGNLRAALAWLHQSCEAELMLRLSASLSWFWGSYGHPSEGARWLEQALTIGTNAPSEVRGRAVASAALMASIHGESAQVSELTDKALALFEESGNDLVRAYALIDLGWALYRTDWTRSGRLFEESLKLFDKLQDQGGIGRSLIGLGCVALMNGDTAKGTALFEQSLEVFQQFSNDQGIAHAVYNLGWASLVRGDLDVALARFKDSLARFTKLGENPGVPMGFEGLAAVAAASHDAGRAACLLGAAWAMRDSMGIPLSRSDRVRYERYLVAARDEVEPTVWDTAWMKGETLTPEQAVHYAMEI